MITWLRSGNPWTIAFFPSWATIVTDTVFTTPSLTIWTVESVSSLKAVIGTRTPLVGGCETSPETTMPA